jgi:hypothetical protein
MRYKTFRTLAIVGVVGAGAAGLYGLSRRDSGLEPAAAPPPATVPAPRLAAAVEPGAGSGAPAGLPAPGKAEAVPTAPDSLRPMDREILARVAQGVSGDKAKDAVRGRPWKVNLYQDAGQPRVNRLKIDLDRDEKWDEKWTFVTGGGREIVKRQVAPNDDEAYTLEFLLDGERWMPK